MTGLHVTSIASRDGQRNVLAAVAVLGLAAASGAAHGGILFEDNFDDGNIDGWYVSNNPTVTVSGGVVETSTNANNSFYLMRPGTSTTEVTFATGGATIISVSADLQGNNSSATHTSGKMGLYLTFSATATTPAPNRYDFFFDTGSNDNVPIRKATGGSPTALSTTTQTLITANGVNVSDATLNGNLLNFELRLTIGDTSNLLELFVSSQLVSSAIDVTPSAINYVGIAFHADNKNDVRIDNVKLATASIPEPASAALAVLGLGLILPRRRRA